MLDVEGMELSMEDKDILDHPLVGGVILFTRNYYDPKQLSALTQAIRETARNTLLIAVDHEGGRVQRFRQGFTKLPAMGELLILSNNDVAAAEKLAEACGVIMAFELLQHSIDLSFAPVLDLCGVSEVIGDRSFSADADQVVTLASALMRGMKSLGMATTGKHFPGHGSVQADSHIAMPVDARSFDQIKSTDLDVFKRINQTGLLDAVMPAHVIYSQIDDQPAGFSKRWIQSILRQQMQFSGVVFSDDLSMQAATVAGDACDRAVAALSAGCDMALVCNDRSSAVNVLDNLTGDYYIDSNAKKLSFAHEFYAVSHRHRYKDACGLLSQVVNSNL